MLETPCSILRWAIDRRSSLAGRRGDRALALVSASKTTIRLFPRALAVIIAISAQATSSRGLAACSGPRAIPIESVTGPAW